MQFATNHLGHFALALGLHDALAAAGGARIVSVSSSGHLRSPVVFDDIDFAFRDYDPFRAYGQSKTANVLFAVEATRRWAGDGIIANALMPGGIATDLQRHLDPRVHGAAPRAAGGDGSSRRPSRERRPRSLLATSPQLEGIGGRYFEDCNEASRSIHRRGEAGLSGVAALRARPDNAERLWDVSLRLLG